MSKDKAKDKAEEPHPNQKFTDKQLEQALINNQGQPTKASAELGVSYPAVYLRIRSNPKLKAVQASYKAQTSQTMVNLAHRIALQGLIKEPQVDDEGNVMFEDDGKTPIFRERKVDYGTRTNVILKLAEMFKGEDGTIDNLNITLDGKGVAVGDWLRKMQEERQNKKDEEQAQ